ncbi:MAG: serine hydrolase domain-containing protein, partial [Pseudomonadota bacterium]
MRRAAKVLAVGLLGLVGWLLWPYYQFEAHSGNAPLPPWGWQSMDGEAPATQRSFAARYAEAGDRVLALAAEHRRAIGAPALSVAVAIDGELAWHGATGWADLAARTLVTPATRFRIGSTSKAVTGTALARLVDKGVIALDAPLSRYFDPLPNPAWASITPRQLASHMAGVPHYGENQDWTGLYRTVALRTHYSRQRDALGVFDGSPLLFEPGTAFSYSSLGTVLLGATMAAAADRPYLDIVRDEVLAPSGMTSTGVAPVSADRDGPFATFYYRDGDRYREWRPV